MTYLRQQVVLSIEKKLIIKRQTKHLYKESEYTKKVIRSCYIWTMIDGPRLKLVRQINFTIYRNCRHYSYTSPVNKHLTETENDLIGIIEKN